jgi:hypothetical protein
MAREWENGELESDLLQAIVMRAILKQNELQKSSLESCGFEAEAKRRLQKDLLLRERRGAEECERTEEVVRVALCKPTSPSFNRRRKLPAGR